MLFVLVGAISCYGYGLYLDRTSSYLKTLKFILVGSRAKLLFATVFVTENTLWSAIIFCISGGFILVPIVPVGFTFATEVTHPVSPALVIRLLCCFSNNICFLMTELFLLIFQEKATKKKRA